MEPIGPVTNQEINIFEKKLGSNKADRRQKTFQTELPSQPDFVVISRIVHIMNNYLSTVESDIKIKAYKKNDEIIIQAISKENGTIIKTISSGKLLTLNSTISDMIGFIVNEKV